MDGERALYARISLTQDACGSWLESPISDEDGAITVDAFLDLLAENGICDIGYEHDEQAYIIAILGIESGADAVAALQGAAAFIDIDVPGYICLLQADDSSDPYVLVELRRRTSRFISPDSDDPNVLYFLNEAEDMIEDLSE